MNYTIRKSINRKHTQIETWESIGVSNRNPLWIFILLVSSPKMAISLPVHSNSKMEILMHWLHKWFVCIAIASQFLNFWSGYNESFNSWCNSSSNFLSIEVISIFYKNKYTRTTEQFSTVKYSWRWSYVNSSRIS